MFVTLFFAIANVRTGEVRFTNAGHNPPYILRKDGSLECLDQRHGPIIAAVEGVAFREDKVQLEETDTLVVFTDGVTEAMDISQQLYAEPRLEACIRKSDGIPDQLTGEILQDVEQYAGEAEQADDITILAFRIEQPPKQVDTYKLHLAAKTDLSEIERINTEFRQFADEHGLAAGVGQKVSIVFDDLLNNIISYGFSDDEEHEIDIDVLYMPNKLVITITDDGIPFNPFDQIGPDTSLSIEERDIGGLGVLLIKKLMDEYQYQRHSNSNVVTLTLFLES
jgi:sigma-B regulation protein RsbU (phosphoserine phosphatase)